MKKILSLLSAVTITTGVATSVSACAVSDYTDDSAILKLASWNDDGRNINLTFDEPNPKYSASDFQVTYYDIKGDYKTIGVTAFSESVLTINENMPSDANFDKMFVTCTKTHSVVKIDSQNLEKNMISKFKLDPDSKNESGQYNAFDINMKFWNNVYKVRAEDFSIKLVENKHQIIYKNGNNYVFNYYEDTKKAKITINDPNFNVEKASSVSIKYKEQKWVEMQGPNPAFIDVHNLHKHLKLALSDVTAYQESYDLTQKSYGNIANWPKFVNKYHYFYYDFNAPDSSWYDYTDELGETTEGDFPSVIDLTALSPQVNGSDESYDYIADMNLDGQLGCTFHVNAHLNDKHHLLMTISVYLDKDSSYEGAYYTIHLHGDGRFVSHKLNQ